MCPVGNWNANCGYEEALHSHGEVLVLPVKGTRLARVHALVTGSATVNLSWAYSGFNSTSLLFSTGCVDSSGSLSGGAFNQLKLVTLSIV